MCVFSLSCCSHSLCVCVRGHCTLASPCARVPWGSTLFPLLLIKYLYVELCARSWRPLSVYPSWIFIHTHTHTLTYPFFRLIYLFFKYLFIFLSSPLASLVYFFALFLSIFIVFSLDHLAIFSIYKREIISSRPEDVLLSCRDDWGKKCCNCWG